MVSSAISQGSKPLIPKASKLGTILLSLLPTSEAALPVALKTVPVATVAASTLLTGGCSQNNFSESSVNRNANERAAYHLQLANAYYDLLSEVVNDIDRYNLDDAGKKNLLNWHKKVEFSRQSLLKAFNSNDIAGVSNKIKSLAEARPTEQQEQAHYYYRQLTRQAYFSGLSNRAFEPYHGDNTTLEPFRTFVHTVQGISDQDLPTESALRASLAYHDSTKHSSVPWGYSVLGSSELGDFGILNNQPVEFGKNQPSKETLKDFGRK